MAVKIISNTSGLLRAQIVGGGMNNLAGTAHTNLALGMVNAKSGKEMTSKSELIVNSTLDDIRQTGGDGIKSKSPIIACTAMNSIKYDSGRNIKHKATLALIKKSDSEQNKIAEKSDKQSIMIKDKGDLVINND